MKYFLIVVCIFASVYSCFARNPRVQTENGELIGTTYTLPNGRVVDAFLDVPFAAPPVGRYRFEEPRPLKPWSGSKNATASTKFCVQFFHKSEFTELLGQEDCLYLNIYTPRLPKDNDENTELMNVMFYIYGGGFSAGAAARIIPDYILQDEDIVFVCPNYRGGPFGFFSTGDDITPGNNGLKDQIEALKWLQKNIHHFGGDPAKVTIYGSSAGAASVQFLLLSPLSKGLFQNAISTAGSALNPWALRKTVVENSFDLASSLNCPTFNTRLMMICLKRRPLKKLYQASLKYFKGKIVTQIPFSPVIEHRHKRAILTEHPHELLKKGHVMNVPLMVGVDEQDASPSVIAVLYNETKLTELNNQWNKLAPILFDYDYVNCTRRRDNISFLVKERYFGDEDVAMETSKELFKVFGDRLFYNGIIEFTKLYSAAISEKNYCYKFYYRGTGSHCDHHSNPVKKNYGACHGDDQFYLISFTNRTKYSDNVKSKVDLDMVKLSTSTVIAFMKKGNPTTSDVKWQPLSRNGVMNCLNIYSYTHQRMFDIENADDSEFWREILSSEY